MFFTHASTYHRLNIQPARSRVVSWLSEAVDSWGLSVSGGVLGEVNTGQRREINKDYFTALGQAKIIITCNVSYSSRLVR